jgi:hypothetical protein
LFGEGAQKFEVNGPHFCLTRYLTWDIESDIKIANPQPNMCSSDISRVQSGQRLVESETTNVPFANAAPNVVDFDNHRNVDAKIWAIADQCKLLTLQVVDAQHDPPFVISAISESSLPYLSRALKSGRAAVCSASLQQRAFY